VPDADVSARATAINVSKIFMAINIHSAVVSIYLLFVYFSRFSLCEMSFDLIFLDAIA